MLIFCFHHVEPVPRIKARKSFTITPLGLQWFIKIIRLFGMKVVSVDEVLSNLSPETLNNHRLCMITFDDGYENVFQYGFPVLLKLKCPATLFVLGNRISGVNDWDPVDYEGQFPDPLLSLKQMQLMANSGLIKYGSHGLTHQNMTKINSLEIKAEIVSSYTVLLKNLQQSFVPVFAYPWGKYTRESLKVLKNSDYLFAFTTENGTFNAQSERWTIPRISIDYRFSNPVFTILKLIELRVGIFNFRGLGLPRYLSLLRRRKNRSKKFVEAIR